MLLHLLWNSIQIDFFYLKKISTIFLFAIYFKSTWRVPSVRLISIDVKCHLQALHRRGEKKVKVPYINCLKTTDKLRALMRMILSNVELIHQSGGISLSLMIGLCASIKQ